MAFPTTQQGFGPISQENTLESDNQFPALKNGDVSLPATPKLSVFSSASAHGVHGYAVSKADLGVITEALYVNPLEIWEESYFTNWGITKALFESWYLNKYNPVDGILDCFYLPDFNIDDKNTEDSNPEKYPTKIRVGTSNYVKVNGISLPLILNNPDNYSPCSTHFYWKRFGSLAIDEYFKSFLDYAPYTKMQIYLPFIGIQEIQVNLCMGGSIELDYLINAFNGNCTAFLTLTDRNGNSRLVNSATGNCAIHVPITSYIDTTLLNLTSSAVSAGVAIGGALVSAGATTAVAAQGVAAAQGALEGPQRIANSYQEQFGEVPAQYANAVSHAQQNLASARLANSQAWNKAFLTAGSGVAQGVSTIGGGLSSPQSYAMCGNVSGDMAIMSQLTPYIIIFRPTPCTPYNYNHYFGRPSNITGKIKDFTNFNQFGVVNVSIKDASDVERAEIKSILSAGVILPEYERLVDD